MVKAALLLLLFIGGLYLAGVVGSLKPNTGEFDSFDRAIGWACVLFALWNWRTVYEGAKGWGKLTLFVLAVITLAYITTGDGELWNLIF